MFDSGEFMQALEASTVIEDDIHAKRGEIVAGNVSGRTSDDEIIVFDSGGTGIETVAAAYMRYDVRARR